MFEVLTLDDEVVDVLGSDEVLLVVELKDERVLVVLVDLATLALLDVALVVELPDEVVELWDDVVEVIAGSLELLVVLEFWTTDEVEEVLELLPVLV